jgi:hypothetical protein
MGVVNTTYTFQATDTITSLRMNNIIDETTFTFDAIFGTTLEVTSGKLKVRSLGITSNELAANAVTTAKITDGSITNDKINAAAAIAPSKLGSGAIPATTTVTTTNIVNAAITAEKLNGAQTGTAPIYGARAYGSFNGSTSTPHTPIKAGNVASIVRTGTGVWTVTLTTAMPSSDYTVVANATHKIGDTFGTNCWVDSLTSTTFVLRTSAVGPGAYNSILISFVVFG